MKMLKDAYRGKIEGKCVAAFIHNKRRKETESEREKEREVWFKDDIACHC